MKKSITETLNAFTTNPIEAKKVYFRKSSRWYAQDDTVFWRMAMAAYPDDDLKKTANRLIKFLYDNDLIEYDCIISDFFSFYEDYGYDCDVGLKTYTLDYIVSHYADWLENAEDDEVEDLLEALEDAEQVWYWKELLSYCIEDMDCEYEFFRMVASQVY